MQVLIERFRGCADKFNCGATSHGRGPFSFTSQGCWTLTARPVSAARLQSICQEQKEETLR
jgi:hypothetical protein